MDGLVDVLRRWSRSWERPVAVVGMPSRRYPTLVRSVAEHIAAVGRLPLVHALAISGPPPAVDAASAVRAKDLLYRTALAPGVSFAGPVCSSITQFVRGGQRPWRQLCSPMREQSQCCRSPSISCHSRSGYPIRGRSPVS